MDDLARGAFLGEIEIQCIFALNAWAQLQKAVSAYEPLEPHPLRPRFEAACEAFRSIHSLLTHAACVSRLMWPPSDHQRAQRRAELLRGLIDISIDDSEVLSQRDLRNHLEHYDERLDKWASSASERTYIHEVIGPYRLPRNVEERDIMRWYDPTTYTYGFQGEVFDLAKLRTALEHVFVCVREALLDRDPTRPTYGPRAVF